MVSTNNGTSSLVDWCEFHDGFTIVLSDSQEALIRTIRGQLLSCLEEFDVFDLSRQTAFCLDKKTIYRYCQSFGWNEEYKGRKLVNYIIDTVFWRLELHYPFRASRIPVLRTELASKKMFTAGRDLSGNPIVYFYPSRQNTENEDNFIIALIYTIERACQAMIKQTGCACGVIVNCQGCTMSNSPSWATIKRIIEVVGMHMPRRLEWLCVTHTSTIVSLIWDAASLILSDQTTRKVKIISSDVSEIRRVLSDRVSLDVLDSATCGNANISEPFDVDRYLQEDLYLQSDTMLDLYA